MSEHIGERRSLEAPGAAPDRRSRRLWIAGAIAVPVLLAGAIPSPYVLERPGPVVDTLGDVTVDDAVEPVVSFPDAKTYPTSGTLNLLTVQVLGSPDDRRSWLSLVPGLVDPSQRIAPLTDFFREGETSDDREAQNTALMAGSQTTAAAAAFRATGAEVGVVLTVAEVAPGSAADGVLQAGDRLIALDGDEIESFAMLRERTVAAGDGGLLRLGIERDGDRLDVELSPTVPEGGEEPLIGATIATDFELPSEVDISLDDIGGPSAGMVFSLAMYDRLTPGELLGGMTVSGTGTMSDGGEVGPIGGLEQKMWAASRAGSDLFLMPLGNCADLPEHVPGEMPVAPVATLDEAIDAVETAAAGGTPAGLERCGADVSARTASE
ncbi:YlbL family protein [Leucobacter chromiiresistens]|uniref:PDZ domain-containing protein n=1 Tax=Leucobacter chromiiresistens TaxID=1079994 RepID=A0A1H1ACM1_9MICO|nr:S16 family serine protease [Leucobacter chromiiresistens]SDQ36986.1 PDZ domain-containing protein [Leucobacter chromiiresistens]